MNASAPYSARPVSRDADLAEDVIGEPRELGIRHGPVVRADHGERPRGRGQLAKPRERVLQHRARPEEVAVRLRDAPPEPALDVRGQAHALPTGERDRPVDVHRVILDEGRGRGAHVAGVREVHRCAAMRAPCPGCTRRHVRTPVNKSNCGHELHVAGIMSGFSRAPRARACAQACGRVRARRERSAFAPAGRVAADVSRGRGSRVRGGAASCGSTSGRCQPPAPRQRCCHRAARASARCTDARTR